MRLLVDTHVWLWWLTAPDRIGDAALDALTDEANTVYFSTASAWEVVIKYSLGKLPLPEPPNLYIPTRNESLGVAVLDIEIAHALTLMSLPPLHRDPFDRMLISQARVEGLAIVTADDKLSGYEVELLRAD